MLILIAFLSPESPRWLMLKGRSEEAKKVIFTLHTVRGDEVFASQEFAEIQKQTAIDQTLETSWVIVPTTLSHLSRGLSTNENSFGSCPCSPNRCIAAVWQ